MKAEILLDGPGGAPHIQIMTPPSPSDLPCGREHPARGVLETSDGRTILFCTACSKDREAWLDNTEVAEALADIWRTDASAWITGRWLLMPDHVHFFCTPSVNGRHSVERWAEFWKDTLAKRLRIGPGKWQRGLFHHRVRSVEHYIEKLDYVQQNPVRAGLVDDSANWPWQGEIERITWD